MDPTTALGLQLLANSNTPGNFGSIFGKSALQAGQDYQAARMNQVQLQQQQLALQAAQQKQAFMQQLMGGMQQPPSQGLMGDQPSPPGAAPQAPQAPQSPPQGQPAQNQTPTAQGLPSWLTPLSPAQIGNIPVNGLPGPLASRAAMMLQNKDAATAQKETLATQYESAQRTLGPKLQTLDYLIKADKPTQYMKADPQLMAAWPAIAQQAGIDPSEYNDDNVRRALAFARNQVATSIGLPASAPPNRLVTKGIQQIDPVTGKVEKELETGNYVTPQGIRTVSKEEAIEKGYTPYNQVTYGTSQLQDPKIGALDAALTTAGINIPGGRSGQQRIATLTNLIRANPDADPQDIANKVRTGQLDFNGAKRSTGQLSTLSAAADVQSRKIEKDLASLGPIVQKLPGGPAKIANVLTNLQKDWSWNGDKDTTEAVGYIKELAGEYAKLVSGSTGMAAPAEGEMKSALGLMQSALTKNGYAGMQEFLRTTSQNRRDAVREGLQDAAAPGKSTGSASGSDKHPADITALLSKYGS